MDVLYPVRGGDWNEELRFSLRSLSLFPHDRVFLVGGKPPWVRNVIHLPREQVRNRKYQNATINLIWGMDHAEVSDPFLYMNDDFYFLRPMRRVPRLHMGPMGEVIDWYRRMRHTGAYWRNMRDTYQLLKGMGYGRPLSYELHVPMVMYKGPLLRAFQAGQHLPGLHIRSMYGNMAKLGGKQIEDVKVYRARDTGQYSSRPFLSSNDDMTLTPMYQYLLSLFPEKGPYESH